MSAGEVWHMSQWVPPGLSSSWRRSVQMSRTLKLHTLTALPLLYVFIAGWFSAR